MDALADKRLYEQELARTREENAFLQDQVGGRPSLPSFSLHCPFSLCSKSRRVPKFFVFFTLSQCVATMQDQETVRKHNKPNHPRPDTLSRSNNVAYL